jgi:hypothetical protein
LGDPIDTSSGDVNSSGDVFVGGDNNAPINTGNVINLDPTSRTRRSSSNLSANVKISFSNRGLEYAGVRLNYTSSSNTSASRTGDSQDSKNDVAVGFEIDYTRKDVPDAPKVEGADRSGQNVLRSTEGGGTLKFAFDTPLDKGDSVTKVVVGSGERIATAEIKRPDGSTYVETARLSSKS